MDRALFGAVLDNLLENAVKYSGSRATIDIKHEYDTINHIIEIKDHGQGISEEKKQKLFQKWNQDKSGKHNSTGLGLFMCKKIINRHQGNVVIESNLEIGTTVTLRLPEETNETETITN